MRARAWICLFGLLLTSAPTAWAKRAACVGDSITYGSGITNRMYDSYPAQLERELAALGMDWEVGNFGVSGATLLRRGDKPYMNQTAYNQARTGLPDMVVIMLGTKDSKEHNWQYSADFSVLATDRWHELRLVWDGAKRYLFVDDQKIVADTVAPTNMKLSRRSLLFGTGHDFGADSYWNGPLDEIRIYEEALLPQ